jgi:hypothetical protein
MEMQVPPAPLPNVELAQQAAAEANLASEAMSKTESKENNDFPLKFCTVCASNQNRFVLPFSLRFNGGREASSCCDP